MNTKGMAAKRMQRFVDKQYARLWENNNPPWFYYRIIEMRELRNRQLGLHDCEACGFTHYINQRCPDI